MAMTMTEPAPPPSREPGQADAVLEADIAVFLKEMEHWNNPPRTAALTLRILADRTRDKERIVELERKLGFWEDWSKGAIELLAQEVPDAQAE